MKSIEVYALESEKDYVAEERELDFPLCYQNNSKNFLLECQHQYFTTTIIDRQYPQ